MTTDIQKQRCAIMVRGIEQEKARQIQDLREDIASNGWQEVELIEESDVSGAAMTRAIELANTGQIDRLMLHNISRIAKRASDAHAMIEHMTDLGISLYWHSQKLETIMSNGSRNPGASMVLTLSIATELGCVELANQPHWCDGIDWSPKTVQKVKKAIAL